MADATIDLRDRGRATPAATAERPGGRLHGGKTLLAWDAPEHVVYVKSMVWYVGFGIVWALLLFTAFVPLKSFLTGVVFTIGGVLIFLYSERPPRMVHFEILDTGITIGGRVLPYKELTGFNLTERADAVYILLRGHRLLVPLIHVPVADTIDPRHLRNILAKHTKEDDTLIEPLADVIAHWLGF